MSNKNQSQNYETSQIERNVAEKPSAKQHFEAGLNNLPLIFELAEHLKSKDNKDAAK